MSQSTGYYSIIQYCPDLARMESANVGVLLFSPEHAFLEAMVDEKSHRVKDFFPDKKPYLKHLTSFQQGLVERLHKEKPEIKTAADLELFVARRANSLRLTNPLPIKVADPQKDLEQLFYEVVVPEAEFKAEQSRPPSLNRLFKEAKLGAKLRKKVSVFVPVFGVQEEIPFGFQNGRFNLIKDVTFSEKGALNKVSRYALEGESLYRHRDSKLGNLQLVIVAQFPSQASDLMATAKRVLTAKEVRLFSMDAVDELIEEIRVHGKEFTEDDAIS